MKKIITVSMIKNEADIVETFVRYTMNFASKMVFIDNGCTDGSIEILNALKSEGFDIEIYCEAHIFYEQYMLENKYIKKITEENEFDFLIPLDVDEFLTSDHHLEAELEKLPKDRVSIIPWKTYVLKSQEDCEGFFLERIRYLRVREAMTFYKVILPYPLLKEKKLSVTMGHHDVECEVPDIRTETNKVYIAHFPVRSQEQIQLKIYQGIIGQLMSSYHKIIAFHWRKLFLEIKNKKFNLLEYSHNYALGKGEEIDFSRDVKEYPFDYKWCKGSVVPRYQELVKIDVLNIIYDLAELVCLKSIIKDQEKEEQIQLLVYGTGNIASELEQYIDVEKYKILAYINSDPEREYAEFKDRLILAPSKIKFFNYDKILIASRIYFQEIKDHLLELGVSNDKILSIF